ncbi:hypothetical protein NPIL_376701 [Nephila pilipes]|uniref:Uncharacterized protein n=1 Tax=Nephila pilipes TaxID=299642 RepID=A0A8X6NCR4_NEPPI|nr:hypothetical protein NPIL_376701 [Nephila pilipes]
MLKQQVHGSGGQRYESVAINGPAVFAVSKQPVMVKRSKQRRLSACAAYATAGAATALSQAKQQCFVLCAWCKAFRGWQVQAAQRFARLRVKRQWCCCAAGRRASVLLNVRRFNGLATAAFGQPV